MVQPRQRRRRDDELVHDMTSGEEQLGTSIIRLLKISSNVQR